MSVKNGVLIEKLQSLDKTLAELRSLGEVTEKQLDIATNASTGGFW